MTKKDAVVYAGWFPDLERPNYYINALQQNYKTEDVFFGINPSQTNFHKTLPMIGYDKIDVTPAERVVNSDASAFQTALKILKTSNETYDKIHFLHTKGISYQNTQAWHSSFDSYYLGYMRKKEEVISILDSNNTVGGVSYVGRDEPMNGSGYSTVLDKYYNFKINEVENIMSLITFYTIRGNIVKEFLNGCKEEFFTDKLDRYFFETSFPLIVDRFGHKRQHLVKW
jgi:hypothetical protein